MYPPSCCDFRAAAGLADSSDTTAVVCMYVSYNIINYHRECFPRGHRLLYQPQRIFALTLCTDTAVQHIMLVLACNYTAV